MPQRIAGRVTSAPPLASHLSILAANRILRLLGFCRCAKRQTNRGTDGHQNGARHYIPVDAVSVMTVVFKATLAYTVMKFIRHTRSALNNLSHYPCPSRESNLVVSLSSSFSELQYRISFTFLVIDHGSPTCFTYFFTVVTLISYSMIRD